MHLESTFVFLFYTLVPFIHYPTPQSLHIGNPSEIAYLGGRSRRFLWVQVSLVYIASPKKGLHKGLWFKNKHRILKLLKLGNGCTHNSILSFILHELFFFSWHKIMFRICKEMKPGGKNKVKEGVCISLLFTFFFKLDRCLLCREERRGSLCLAS